MTPSDNSPPRVLVVDDEADIRELIEVTLGRMGLRTRAAEDLAQARKWLDTEHFNLCLTDMRLPDGDGIELVAHIQNQYPKLPVAVITAYGSTETAVASLKAGAFDFATKPLKVKTLRKLVNDALQLDRPVASSPSNGASTLLGHSPVIEELKRMIGRVARSQAPIHIAGESGTGKELVARTIHARGPRASHPFIPVNCGAIPTELMESELFGHVRGSFTGAVSDNPGLFRSAEGGTLFLDEIAELPLHMQVKLLRALQERSIRPVGSTSEIPVDVRIISATHQDLAARMTDGRFRQDLYYRLNVIEIRTPPLREHPEDIPELAQSILARIAKRTPDAPQPPELGSDALQTLAHHPFPGNVRELENVLERALALCDQHHIAAANLSLRGATPVAEATSDPRISQSESDTPTTPVEEASAPSPVGNTPDADSGQPLGERLAGMQRQAIISALEKTHWNRTKAAELLGMSFRQLRYRLKKLEIE
ncbi:MAG: sigma-54 dependent transcriptional regulator [Sinobacteraceae bacterium]|nr:sigma-54 dependent transcriptional regulator [Nevskiaceae bacterium]